jgi:hypothetical protein
LSTIKKVNIKMSNKKKMRELHHQIKDVDRRLGDVTEAISTRGINPSPYVNKRRPEKYIESKNAKPEGTASGLVDRREGIQPHDVMFTLVNL